MTYAVLFAHHLSLPVVSIGFALTLVAVLVTAEEREIRRGKTGESGRSGG